VNPLQVGSKTNPAEFANKSSKNIGTLVDSIPVLTVRAATTDRLACRTRSFGAVFSAQQVSLKSNAIFDHLRPMDHYCKRQELNRQKYVISPSTSSEHDTSA
jgi:hypothetical protein